MDKTMQAASYLNSNASLREALEISPDASLVLEPLGKGEHNENYVFSDPASGRRFVLRINVLPQPFHDNQVAYEFAALNALSESGCTPQPLYLDDSAQAPGYGALVESFCEGQQLDFDHLRPGDLRCAAQLMADLHAIPVTDDLPLHRPKDPLRELYEECVGRFDYYMASGHEDPRVTRWMRRYIDAVQPALETSPVEADLSHVVNTETLASHFLIPEHSAKQAAAVGAEAAAAGSGGRFCDEPGYFVDWERPLIGEVAQDLAMFLAPTTTFWDSDYLFPRADIQAFLDDYWRAVDGRFPRGAFDLRFWAYLKLSVFRSQMWCCKALARYGVGGSGHKTEKTIAKLPIYLSDEFNEMLFRECF